MTEKIMLLSLGLCRTLKKTPHPIHTDKVKFVFLVLNAISIEQVRDKSVLKLAKI
jgi:hypothetical protein